MTDSTTVADGTVISRAEREGMSVATFQSTRPLEARYVTEPGALVEAGEEPAGLIQIGPTDI